MFLNFGILKSLILRTKTLLHNLKNLSTINILAESPSPKTIEPSQTQNHQIYKQTFINQIMIWPWILIGLIVAIAVILIYYYNKFITLENRIENSLAQIDVQLKKRADLVPSLVKVVKGYAKHERKIMEQVTKARSQMLRGSNLQDRVKSGDQLQNALKSIFAIAENYPQLKANENYLHLQRELSAIEDKVAYARQYYNDSILDIDNASEKFPGVLFFKLYGRKKKDYLKIPEANKEMPEIDL